MAGLPLDHATFLAKYWQRKPLLIRNAVPGFEGPIDADELAGLAMEPEIESRIVEQQGEQWQLSQGPFEAEDFDRPSPWTLLVQSVDHYIPAVAELLQLVDFLPRWRVDDIMVSYATDGGSVGPHYDHYDVFLLQGSGQREWRLGQHCALDEACLSGTELRILAHFEESERHLLNPGDILYVPPQLAHWGIARGECMTWSLGFRAPRLNDLLSRWVDAALEQLPAEQLFTDRARPASLRAGEIDPADVKRAKQQLLAALERSSDPLWFGETITEPRYPLEIETHHDEGQLAYPEPSARIAWQESVEGLVVFCNGQSRPSPAETIAALEVLCNGESLAWPEENDNELHALLQWLLEQGGVYRDD